MIIDFNKIEEKTLPHFKGGDNAMLAHMFDDGLNRILQGCLPPGASIGCHRHDSSSEIMFFTHGHGHVTFDGQPLAVSAGSCHYCPKGHSHSVVNDGDDNLQFLAVVPQQ